MAIPDYESLMLPLLTIAAEANGVEKKLSVAVDELADTFKLTEEERTELLPSGATFKFASRVSRQSGHRPVRGRSLKKEGNEGGIHYDLHLYARGIDFCTRIHVPYRPDRWHATGKLYDRLRSRRVGSGSL